MSDRRAGGSSAEIATNQSTTREAAEALAALSDALRTDGNAPMPAARFAIRLAAALFADAAGRLPDGALASMIAGGADTLQSGLSDLVASARGVPDVGRADEVVIADASLAAVRGAAACDWYSLDPFALGTLFERALDPELRSALGAHYTPRDMAAKVIDPIVRRPLEQAWEVAFGDIDAAIERDEFDKAQRELDGFMEMLSGFVALDPAAGGGNFLVAAMEAMRAIEDEVVGWIDRLNCLHVERVVGPDNVRGIEINPSAAELARLAVWICDVRGGGAGEADWHEVVVHANALIGADGGEAAWPEATVAVGNPPFIGGMKLRTRLGDDAAEALRKLYKKRIPGRADLVTYWFQRAGELMRAGELEGFGFVATNSIRNGDSNAVIRNVGFPISDAWSDIEWPDGAASVRVSIACFARHPDGVRIEMEA